MKTQLALITIAGISTLTLGCETLTGRAPVGQQKLATANKPVMQVGRGLTPDLEEREALVTDKVQSKQAVFAGCYDKALSKGNLPRTDGIFYFSVDQAGNFTDISGETAADANGKSVYADLRSCIQETLGNLKVGPYAHKLTYRFRVFFGQRVD